MPTITQAGVVTSSLTNVPASSYSFVAGFTTHEAASAQHSINISTHNVGNLLVSIPWLSCNAPVGPFTAPTSTNSTAWQDSSEFTFGITFAMGLWIGRASSIGAATLTVPYAAGTTPTSCLTVLEYTCPGVDSGTIWSFDVHGHNTGVVAAPTQSYPFLTPTVGVSLPEIYVGNMFDNTASAGISPGATPGFSYLGTVATDFNMQAVNSAVTGPTAPSANSNPAGTAAPLSVAGLIKATIAKAIFDNIRITLQPVPTGRMWIISQIGFEFLPTNTLQTMTANIVLNGRVIKPGINPNAGQFQGPPYITVRAGDTMWVDLFNVPVGSSAIANFLYNEYSAYATAHELGGVV